MAVKLTTLSHFSMLATRCKTEINKLKTSIPTKTSQLTNDSNFQTSEQVVAAIANSNKLSRTKVDSIESIDKTAPDADKKIYLVPSASASGNNSYDEYMIIDGNLELMGTTAVDLAGYLKESDVADDLEISVVLDTVFGAIAV